MGVHTKEGHLGLNNHSADEARDIAVTSML